MVLSSGGGEHVYATLLLNDSYLPGALVLAHSLRDAGTTKKLAVLVTTDTVTADAITQLETVYDYILPVPRIRNDRPANLYLMDRADLHSAFTKINLWKQTQFSRIVYIDADVVAYRAPDELFDLPHAFAASPDIGWPDLFNTGVMALTPNAGDYYALVAMAERGISFDGADQGLLNMYFKNDFHRLPFTYNVTPSAHYQYLPAYRHLQSSINMVHFIGANKPWFAGRHVSYGGSAYDEMVGRWWAVYDRHYREQELSRFAPGQQDKFASKSWDAQKQPPPTNSRPEAANFPSAHYEMSRDASQFVPPGGIREHPAPPPIFPWEGHQPKPSRSFGYELQTAKEPPLEQATATREALSPIELPSLASSTVSTKSEAVTPTTPTQASHGAAPWTSFQRVNAWDDVPGINRYVEGFEKHQRSRSRSLKGAQDTDATNVQDGTEPHAFKLTDFPSEVERPSLPVTPAPIRGSSTWLQGDDPEVDNGQSLLPAAEGVPAQPEWDPTEQLQKLSGQHSEALLRRLGGEEPDSLEAFAPSVLSPQPVKGTAAVATTALERKMENIDIESRGVPIRQPSYSGPGVAWDKGEDFLQHETPLLPTEEERDVLDT